MDEQKDQVQPSENEEHRRIMNEWAKKQNEDVLKKMQELAESYKEKHYPQGHCPYCDPTPRCPYCGRPMWNKPMYWLSTGGCCGNY